MEELLEKIRKIVNEASDERYFDGYKDCKNELKKEIERLKKIKIHDDNDSPEGIRDLFLDRLITKFGLEGEKKK